MSLSSPPRSLLGYIDTSEVSSLLLSLVTFLWLSTKYCWSGKWTGDYRLPSEALSRTDELNYRLLDERNQAE